MKQRPKLETPTAATPEELPDYDQVKLDCQAMVREHEKMKRFRAMDNCKLVGTAVAAADLAFELKFEAWIRDITQHQPN